MKKLFAMLVLCSSFALGQAAYIKVVDSATIAASGKTFVHQNGVAELNINVEYVIAGSPTITAIILQGCMRGGTCSTLSTYTGSSNTVIAVSSALFDNYVVTPTWTGGSSPTVTINWLGTANSSGNPAGSLDPCAATTRSVAVINTTASAQLIAGAAGKQTYVCWIQFSLSAVADNVSLVEGTGSTCGTGTAGMAGGATAATGWNLLANASVTGGGYTSFGWKTATLADNVCFLVSSASQISGVIQYVQQ